MEFLALLLPIIIDLITRKVADTDYRFWISAVVCAVFGIGINYLNTQFVFASPQVAFDSLTASILVAFGLAQFSFQAVYKNLNIHEKFRADSRQD